MTLDQYRELKVWHVRHEHDAPLEACVWNLVLTLWMLGWVGMPVALVLDVVALAAVAALLLFLPGRYVAWRAALHRNGRLRCDWIVALR
jgi:hypothetical protein